MRTCSQIISLMTMILKKKLCHFHGHSVYKNRRIVNLLCHFFVVQFRIVFIKHL